jgi:NAD(P)-dependent dehydrogenase (short-subunit alcohol dehydrogenase family)
VINYASNLVEAEITARETSKAGAEPILVKGDVGQDEDCRRIVAAAETHGRIDTLFNNAGTSRIVSYSDLDGLSADDFLRIYRVNVVGPYQMIRAARSLLERSQVAAVVNTSSVAGITGGGSSIAYAASKGALNAMTKALARAVAPKIRVNAICPGYFDSPWFEKLGYRGGQAKMREHISKATPLKVASSAEDIAESALFLGSRAALRITGETLLADAGLHLGSA